MKRYLLDSNAVTALIARRERFADRARAARDRGDRLGTCELVVAELYYGLEFSASRAENTVRVERALSGLRVWPFDRRAAREYGRIAADLRRRGRPMQAIDVMIAAVAMSLDRCVVVTTDSDLSAVPGLAVEDWTLPPVDPEQP
jgi:tRNA(fMet)-specific endonuclease VapC